MDGDYWQGQDDKEYAQYLFREYVLPRRRAIRESGGQYVDYDHESRSLIVKWISALNSRPIQ